jgi:hypothetical protein
MFRGCFYTPAENKLRRLCDYRGSEGREVRNPKSITPTHRPTSRVTLYYDIHHGN